MRVLLLITIATFLACSSSTTGTEEGLTPNRPAPNFSLNSLQGETFTLSQLEGKVVYLFFYGAECPHCRSNGPVTEREIYQTFRQDTNFVALGIDTWNLSSASNQAFRTVTGISYPLLLNGRQTLVDYYGTISAYDRSVVINTIGDIIYQGTGFVNSDFQTVRNVITQQLDGITP